MFCLIQAIVVIFTLLCVIVFMPDLVLEPEIDGVNSDEEDLAIIKENNEKEEIENRIRVHLGGTQIKSSEEVAYSLFRFDKLRQYDGWDDVTPMVNGEGEYAYFSRNEVYRPDDIPEWFDAPNDFCGGCFVIYDSTVIALKNVILNPEFGHGKKGGEDFRDVFNQPEEDEIISIDKGYFLLDSGRNFTYSESMSRDLRKLVQGLLVKEHKDVPIYQKKKQDMYAVITIRQEFANFYHTTVNWYDIFLIMVLFKIDPYHVEVIWLDAHPKSYLDESWETLYGSPIRAGGITGPIKYRNMIWNGFGARSMLNMHKLEFLPFVDEFRHFVLSRFDIADEHVLNCDELRITIIWRRDYVFHPRNPKGYVSRKLANEEEVWKAVKEADFRAIVNGAQLERLSMAEQLNLIARTDILIGVHGAGMSHILYLPKTAGVIEIYPMYLSVANAHFRALSKWRRLRYIAWHNQDARLEKINHMLEIPKTLIQDLVKTMKKNICEAKSEL